LQVYKHKTVSCCLQPSGFFWVKSKNEHLTKIGVVRNIEYMQSTISLKISQDLVTRLKKASKIRGLSMSDLIRQNLQNTYASDMKTKKEPEIFKYFGVVPDDAELQQFDKDLEGSRKKYKTRVIEF
jgi:hypothetical protein